VIPNAITEAQEMSLLEELLPTLDARKYEDGHWDGVISNYREAEVRSWAAASNREAIDEVRAEVGEFAGLADETPWLSVRALHKIDLLRVSYVD